MEMLPQAETVRAVVQRYAGLIEELGAELGERRLVLPNGRFFPDAFKPNRAGVAKLMRRMQQHAGLDDIPVDIIVHGEPAESEAGNCGSGGCGTGCAVPSPKQLTRIVPAGDGWAVQLMYDELKHPVQLTTTLAIALGSIFLFETAEEGNSPANLEINAEFAAVGLGFGALLMEGAYIYSKGCGGPRVAQLTRLSCSELGIATTLFVQLNPAKSRGGYGDLSPTQQAILKEATAWAASNPRLIELLKRAPEAAARGDFKLDEAKPWLMRLFQRRASSKAPETLEEMEALARTESPSRRVESNSKAQGSSQRSRPDAKKEELRRLVEEALAAEARPSAD